MKVIIMVKQVGYMGEEEGCASEKARKIRHDPDRGVGEEWKSESNHTRKLLI